MLTNVSVWRRWIKRVFIKPWQRYVCAKCDVRWADAVPVYVLILTVHTRCLHIQWADTSPQRLERMLICVAPVETLASYMFRYMQLLLTHSFVP